MGAHRNITAAGFPAQSRFVSGGTLVIFHYDTAHPIRGTVVRDDLCEPWLTIIRLDDGRHVLGTECQWSPDVEGSR